MGPTILIDKSTFQSLSKEDVFYLQMYYYVVYCPTLFHEILGDLSKHQDAEESKRAVGTISYKINGRHTYFTTDFRILVLANLLGHEVKMDRRPILSGGKQFADSQGKRGVLFDEPPEYVALRRWTSGKFSEAEKMHASTWRNSLHEIDLSIAQAKSKYLKNVKRPDELLQYIADALADPDEQFSFLQFLLNLTPADSETRNQICDRWLRRGMPSIKLFAPYAYYCLLAYMTFYFSVAKGFVGTRTSNIIDLEYVLYIPFCMVFVSTDKFLRDFSPLFLQKGQEFIWGNDLKSDLKRLCEYWHANGKQARFDCQKKYGHYPPDMNDSLTNRLWRQYIGPRTTQREMTPERKQQLLRKLRPILNTLRQEQSESG